MGTWVLEDWVLPTLKGLFQGPLCGDAGWLTLRRRRHNHLGTLPITPAGERLGLGFHWDF